MGVFLHDAGLFFRHLAAVDFGALALALAFQALRLVARTRAWRNIIAAAYPDARVRWRNVLGAYLGGVGLNAITPARSGDVLKLFLVKRRVEGSTYPTLGATLVVETLFDAFVGIALLVWAAYLGVLPNIHKLPRLPNIDLRWAFQHPLAIEIGALALGILIGLLLVWATARVRAFWARVRQGFAVLDDRGEYVRTVVTWQALSWVLRLATARRCGHRAGLAALSLPRQGRAELAALVQRRHAHRDRGRERRPRRARARAADPVAAIQAAARRRCGRCCRSRSGHRKAAAVTIQGTQSAPK